jgi:hypothetical protein
MLRILMSTVSLTVLIPGATLLPGDFNLARAQTVALLTLPDTSGTVNQVLRLPMDITDADGAESGTIDVVFDSLVVRPDHESLLVEPFGQQIQPHVWFANTIADTLRIVFATVEGGYVGSGTLVSLEWELVGAGTSPLHFTFIELQRDDDGVEVDLPTIGEDGSIVAAPQPVEPGTWGRLKRLYSGSP